MKLPAQFSLRELLCVVLFAGLGLAALRTGGMLASVVIFLAYLLFSALGIVVVLDRGPLQAFAIGFVIPAVIYGAAVYVMGSSELDPYAGRLPTTKWLLPAHKAMVQQTWIDMSTGQVVPDYDPTTDPTGGNVGGGGFSGGRTMGISESPDRATFMGLAHLLLALLFGYAGAKFGVVLYRRRQPVAT